MTAIQELIRQLKGAIQLIDEHGVLNDYAQCRKEVYESVLDNAVSLAAPKNNQGEGNCKCDNEIKTGQTSAMCCNICGLPDDENWKAPSPLPGTTVQGYSEAKPCEHNWVSSVAYKGAKICSKCSLIK